MTPHDVHIVNNLGTVTHTFPKSGNTIRLKSETVQVDFIGEIPISQTVFGTPTGLPDFQEGTFYIVSQLVKSALPDRKDLLVPAEVLRDSNGVILGCQSLGL